MHSLELFFNDLPVAVLTIDGKMDHYTFQYDEVWVREGYAISPHLPFHAEIASPSIKRFLENLLPEGKGLEDITRFAHISKDNIYGLLQTIGFETSGALHFGAYRNNRRDSFRPITAEELTLRIDEIESRSIIIWDKKPRLSLAGVQEKLPVLLKDGVLGLADGRLSSTHILKFQTKKNPHIVINEYICMSLARKIGLDVASVTLHKYGTHPVLMVERFDRAVRSNGTIERLHIIDGCQMLDLPPSYKYEKNFGSGRDVAVIREGASFAKLFHAAKACEVPATAKLRLLDWALFNLIIGNSDAHGKNISFFIKKSGISVAPYYDMLSILMHEGIDHELAMGYGDEFDANQILGYPLRAFAADTGLNPKLVSSRLKILCSKVLDALGTDIADVTLLDKDEIKFAEKLQQLIVNRIEQLSESADEMMKVSF